MARKKRNRDVLIPNRTMKNDLFVKLYEDEKEIADMASKLFKLEVTGLQVKNLKPVMLGNKANDLSFLLNEMFIYLLEVQSTYNPNMPFRLLQYVTGILAQLIDETDDLYGETLIRLKTPKLYTFFTGICEEEPGSIQTEQKLSSAFEFLEPSPDLEVIVHVFNFNMTESEVSVFLKENQLPERMLKYADNSLFWYSLLVNCIEYYQVEIGSGQHDKKVQMLAHVVHLFKERGILVEFLSKKEVVDVDLMNFSREMDLKLGGRAQGMREGRKEGRKLTKAVFKMLKDNQPDEKIISQLGLTPEELVSYKADFEEVFGE